MIAGGDECRCLHPHAVEENVSRLELPVSGALAHVPRDDDGCGLEGRKELLEGLDLLEVSISSEVEVGKVGNRDD
jgi:hypothetical protein